VHAQAVDLSAARRKEVPWSGPGGVIRAPGNVDVAAEVRVDGHVVGTAAPGVPLALRDLVPGEYALEVRAPGYGRVRESHAAELGRWTQVGVVLPVARGPWGWWADLSAAFARAGAPSWFSWGSRFWC
jgi:hypothetical protein